MVCLVGGCSGEIVERSFSTYADAEKDGAFVQGWLPDFLPLSATEITYEADLDTSMVRVAFNFNVKDVGWVSRYLKRAEITPRATSLGIRVAEPWWDPDLRRRADADVQKKFRFYVGGGLYFAIDWSRPRAFAWTR